MLTIPVVSNENLDITDLTHAVVDGNGVFDVLMKAVKAHIQQEWDANRIKGNEYATLYLSALQTVLQASIQYVLAETKSNIEVEILKQQKLNLITEGSNLVKQGLLIDAQKDKTIQDVFLSTNQTGLLEQQRLNAIQENALIIANKLKADQEILFIEQKKLTEKANTDGTVIGVDSLLDKQRKVFQGQSDGFVRDAEQKAAKLMIDVYNNNILNDNVVDPTNANLRDVDVGAVVTKLKAGIGA